MKRLIDLLTDPEKFIYKTSMQEQQTNLMTFDEPKKQKRAKRNPISTRHYLITFMNYPDEKEKFVKKVKAGISQVKLADEYKLTTAQISTLENELNLREIRLQQKPNNERSTLKSNTASILSATAATMIDLEERIHSLEKWRLEQIEKITYH